MTTSGKSHFYSTDGVKFTRNPDSILSACGDSLNGVIIMTASRKSQFDSTDGVKCTPILGKICDACGNSHKRVI